MDDVTESAYLSANGYALEEDGRRYKLIFRPAK